MASLAVEVESREEHLRDDRIVHFFHSKQPSYDPESTLTVFILHGAGGRTGQLQSIFDSLSVIPNVSCVAYDRIGHGETPELARWEAYATDEFVEDFSTIFWRYHTSRNAFIGHSYGTSIISSFLLRRILREAEDEELSPIKSLILPNGIIYLGTSPSCPTSGIWYLPNFFLNWSFFRSKVNDTVIQLLYHPTTLETNPELVERESLLASSNSMSMMKALCRQMRWIQPEEMAQAVTSILGTEEGERGQMMIVHGEADGIFPLESVEELVGVIRRVAGDSEFVRFEVVEGGGHNVMLEQSEVVSRLIVDFLGLGSVGDGHDEEDEEGEEEDEEEEGEDEVQ